MRLLLCIMFFAFAPAVASAVERFPPPDFESGYRLPQTTTPGPRLDLYEYLDVVILAVALILAAYLALKRRSRTGMAALGIGALAYFGFWRQGCVCPIGAIQNVTLALFDSSYAIPLTVLAFFLMPLVVTLFFGRVFCGAVCPLGAIQDVVLLRPVKVPGWLEPGLRMLPYLYLGGAILFAALGSAFIICQYDPFVGFFRLGASFNMLTLGMCILIIGLFIGRPYCRYLCPYGALLRPLSAVSKWQVKITPDECVKCHLCQDACPFGAIKNPTTEESLRPRNEGKLRLVLLIVLLPVLIVIGDRLGRSVGNSFSRMHATVRLAERVWQENTGKIDGTTDASDAFRHTGQPAEELYAEALMIKDRFVLATRLFGGFVGLIVGLKLVRLSVRRRREDYQADRAHCVACGRCYDYCPVEHERLGELNAPAKPEPPPVWSSPATWAAFIAGVFSITVLTLMIVNHFKSTQADPLDSAQLNDLKAALVRQPKDELLKTQIRRLDLDLRIEYFRRQNFAQQGGHLLLGGVVVFLIAIKSVLAARKKMPAPEPAAELSYDAAHLQTASLWSVGVLAVLFGGAAVLLATSSGPGLVPQSLQATKPQATQMAAYPTSQEIEKQWPRFRGPGGRGISAYDDVPSSWNGATGEGVLWKTPVPLPGKNSPVVWDNRIFLTGADKNTRCVYCFDADSGRLLWQREVENPDRRDEVPEVTSDAGYAACTAVTDGRRVYAIFANGDCAALDFDGNLLWLKSFGPLENTYGHASSLAMYKNLLLVLLDQAAAEDGKSKLIALEGISGKPVWQVDRPVPNSWATPIVIDTKSGAQIITCADPWVIAYEPASGTELWRAGGLGGEIAVSPTYADGLVFAGNLGAELVAIRPEGRGDVTKTHVAWTADENLPDICSPLGNGELLFLVTTEGVLTCYDAKTGTKIWEHDFETMFTSSPSLAAGHVYVTSTRGITFIIDAARQFMQLGRSELGEACHASPAFQDGRIYIRGETHLFCLGKKAE